MDILSRRHVLRLGVFGAFGVGASGCGTILHPERRGQPAGPLDWEIVALDAIGLLLFFVPGVIAFAVDFSNGTIYLPSGGYGGGQPAAGQHRLTSITVPRKELTPAGIECVVSRQADRPVRLVPGQYRTRELDHIEQFWTACESLG